MKILVIGSGFLGSEIVNCSINKNIEVTPARLSGAAVQINGQEIESLRINVLEPESFAQIPQDVTHIIYAVSARDSSESSYENAYYKGIDNVSSFIKSKGQFNKVRFVFISSTGVFTENTGDTVNEESSVLRTDKKYAHLLNGEDLILTRFGDGGLILRLSGIYGEGRRYFVKLAEILSENLNKTKVEDQKINWSNRIHKVDAARACLHLMEAGRSGIYIVSDDRPSINIETIKFIQRKLNIKVLDLETDKLANVLGKRCDNTKLKNEGFQFMYPSYEEGYLELLENS